MSGSLSPPKSGTGVNGTFGGGSNGAGVNGVCLRPGKYLSSNSARSEIVDYASALINGIDLCTSTYISHIICQSCNMSVMSQPLG